MEQLSQIFHLIFSEAVAIKACATDGIHSPNARYLLFREFRASISFAYARAALRGHVSHVLQLRSQKKMFWIHARRIITTVKHAHLLRKISVMNFIREAMGRDESTVSFTNADFSVPMNGLGGRPKPAGPSLFDLVPKSLLDGSLFWHDFYYTAWCV